LAKTSTSPATWPKASPWNSPRPGRRCCLLALALPLLFLLTLTAVVRPVQAQDLQEDFKVAWHAFHDLVKDERKGKYRVYWQDLEKQFLNIYKAQPEGPLAPKSLYYAGRVNEELGRRSFLDSDYRRSVDFYQRVASRFPDHSWTDDCLYRKALIELNYLDDPAAAAKDLETLVRHYPKGDMRPKAKSLLEELAGGGVLARAQSAPSEPEAEPQDRAPSPPKETRVPPQEQAAVQKTSAAAEANGPNTLRDVRHQSSDEYTRIVINADRKVPYRYQLLYPVPELDKPHRLYIDLEDTRMDAGLDSSVKIADGILRQVRIGQNTPTVTRVVLDFQDLQKYQIFAMEDPFRIIVDVSAPDAQKPKVASQNAVRRPVSLQEAQTPEPDSEKTAASEAVKRPVGKPVPKGELKPSPEARAQTATGDRIEKAGPETTTVSRPGENEPEPEQREAAQAPAYTPPPESEKQAATLVEQLGLTVRTIMVDPGHGGRDPGAVGVGGVKEKDINLRFAKILGRQLEEAGFKVLYTRTDDSFIALEDRTAKANLEKADLFVSVHCNAIHLKDFSGMETYYLDLATSKDAVRVAARENAVSTKSISDLQVILTDLMLNSKLKESKDLAKNVHSRVLQGLRQKHRVDDHGVRSAPFYVLMGAKMPAILVELGYVTNAAEARRLQSDAYLELQAQGLVAGIKAYKRNIERFASL